MRRKWQQKWLMPLIAVVVAAVGAAVVRLLGASEMTMIATYFGIGAVFIITARQ